MADLETAAGEAIISVRQLEARISDANARLDQLRESSLAAIDAQCDTVWARLEQQVATFINAVHEQQKLVHSLGQDTLGTLGSTRDALNKAYSVAESHVGEASSMISSLREEVAAVEPEITAMLEALQASAQRLEQQLTTADTELEQATQDARQFIGVEVVEALQQMQQEVQRQAVEVRRAVREEAQAPVEEKDIDWAAKLAEVVGSVQEAFEGTAAHAEAVAAFSIGNCQEAFEGTLKELKSAADTVAAAIETYRVDVEEAQRETSAATGTLESEVAETVAALGSASTTIVNVLTELAKYTWGAL